MSTHDSTVDLLSLANQPIRPFDSIPVIDISGLSGDADSRAKVAIKNHGIDETAIQSTVTAAHRFFDLDLEEKMKLYFRKSSDLKGYYPVARRKYYNESFKVEPNGSTNNLASKWSPWPPEEVLPGFQEAVLKHYHEAASLGSRLFQAFALALNLPEDFFVDKVKTTAVDMRLLHYPAQAEVISDQKPGLGSHTDFECFTILWQDEVPALQVKNSTGQWVDAQPIPGTFIINIGDQLSRWTNDIFKSTVHRVINKSGVQRYSIPLFFSIDHDVKVEVLPSCISDNRPARYEPIIAGDYVKSNLEKTYAYLP